MRSEQPAGHRWRKQLRLALVGLCGLYACYLAVGNLFLRTELGPRLLAVRSEKFQAAWVSGWTVWPGRAHVRELRLRGQTRRTRWEVELARASFDFRVLALAAKRFTARDITGDGLNFRLRRRPEPGEAPASGGTAPDLRGFVSPLVGPPAGPPPPPRRWPWRISLGGVKIDDVREVWIDDQRWVGQGRLTGDWTFSPRGSMEMDASSLTFETGHIFVGDRAIAENVRMIAEARFERFVPSENRGRAKLRYLSGRIRFNSQHSSFGVLERYLDRAPWLDIEGSGQVSADVPIAAGVLAPGGRVEIAASSLALTALEFRAAGRGTIQAFVDEAGDKTRLAAQLTDFELRRLGGSDPVPELGVLVRGEDLSLEALGDAIDLARGPPDLDVKLLVGASAIPDLAAYNRFLPADTALSILAGTGSLAAELAFSTADDSGSGWVDIKAEGATLAFDTAEVSGSARLSLALRGAELEQRRFDVSGTRLELSGFAGHEAGGVAADGGWWGHIELERGQIRAGPSPALEATFQATLRDSRPVVAILAARKPLVGWIGGLLHVEDVSARGILQIDANAWAVDELRVAGEGLEVLADGVRIAPQRREGLFYFSRGPLSAAVELVEGERDWKFLKAREWYRQRAGREPRPDQDDSKR